MVEFFLPEEFIVIGTSLKLHKKTVTIDEIHDYMKKLSVPIEYEDKPFKYVTINEDNTFTVSDNIPINPSIQQLLTNI